jgi:hypothetical protein
VFFSEQRFPDKSNVLLHMGGKHTHLWLKGEKRGFTLLLGYGAAGIHILTKVKKSALGIFQPPFCNLSLPPVAPIPVALP